MKPKTLLILTLVLALGLAGSLYNNYNYAQTYNALQRSMLVSASDSLSHAHSQAQQLLNELKSDNQVLDLAVRGEVVLARLEVTAGLFRVLSQHSADLSYAHASGLVDSYQTIVQSQRISFRDGNPDAQLLMALVEDLRQLNETIGDWVAGSSPDWDQLVNQLELIQPR